MNLALSFALAFAQSPAPAADDPFPVATPESQGLTTESLAKLGALVKDFVEKDEIVGAELLVIKNDHTVLHEGFGWKDRESKTAMPLDTIFCVRSMTKPVVGTAVELLLQDSKLKLGDTVAHHLPSFDNDKSRAITVEELLHHTSGLPLSSLLNQKIEDITSIRQVADLAGAHGPDFKPGERFSYSDDGADTLGTLVEIASGKKLADFLAERVFTPLSMHDAITVVASDHPLRARVASDYLGAAHSWTRFFGPSDPPIFKTLLASQALYCSPRDYARFLALWEHKGKVGDARLLDMSTVKRALDRGTPMGYPTGFEGVETHYGELWMLYVDRQSKSKSDLYAFGHNGSDGTYAWVFPKLDLMVLYFTQSRGADTGGKLETLMQREIVDPLLHVDRKPPASYTDAELDAISGWYASEKHDDLVLVAKKGSAIEIEFPGVAAMEFKATSTRDRWTAVLSPDDTFEIERDANGAPIGMLGRNPHAPKDVHVERWKPDASAPSLDDVMALRKKAVDWEKVASLGALRAKGKLDIPAMKVSGTFTSVSVGLEHYRLDVATNRSTSSTVRDGDRAWSANTLVANGKPQVADGAAQDRLMLASPIHVIADWRTCYRELKVVGVATLGEHSAIVLRATPERGRGRTLFVDAQSGLLLEERIVQLEPGLGELGATIDYDDWRDVGAIKLPFKSTVEHPTPLLGTFAIQWESAELHVELPADYFTMPAAK